MLDHAFFYPLLHNDYRNEKLYKCEITHTILMIILKIIIMIMCYTHIFNDFRARLIILCFFNFYLI